MNADGHGSPFSARNILIVSMAAGVAVIMNLLLKFGMENANFLNNHEKECCTGNNYLMDAGVRERITDAWKICPAFLIDNILKRKRTTNRRWYF